MEQKQTTDTIWYIPDSAFKALATIGIWAGMGFACWAVPAFAILMIVGATVSTAVVWLV